MSSEIHVLATSVFSNKILVKIFHPVNIWSETMLSKPKKVRILEDYFENIPNFEYSLYLMKKSTMRKKQAPGDHKYIFFKI